MEPKYFNFKIFIWMVGGKYILHLNIEKYMQCKKKKKHENKIFSTYRNL